MITPFLQSSSSALSPGPGSQGESEDSVRFHGRSISQLPVEVLLVITHYLSMGEVLALGQVCRDLRSQLERCGVITDIWNYLSLPKNKQRFVRRLVTGNQLLIDHLRNNPVGYSKSFPIQHGPAIYTKYASYFREQTVRASSVTLVLSGCFGELSDRTLCQLNYQHHCLIQDDYDTEQLYVWTKQKDGSWKNEYMIGYQSFTIDSKEHGDGILIIGGDEDGKGLLLIVERNEWGIWNLTHKQYLNEISRSLEYHDIVQVTLAGNQRVILCEVANFEYDSGEIIIFGLDADGRWRTKYRCESGSDFYDFQFGFSQDCGHIALITGERIFIVSEQDDGAWIKTGEIDGAWIKTGEIKSESQFENNLEFSADDHHFVSWSENKLIRRRDQLLRRDVHIIVASLDDQGHWSEVLRINETCDSRIQLSSPHAKFSSDGKQLFVCIDNKLNILSLHDGKWVSSTHLLGPFDDSRRKIGTTMDPSLFMVTSDKTAWIYAIDASGVWGKQHEFPCYPEFSPKISSSGDTVICLHDKACQIDLWSCRHTDQWIKQEFTIPVSLVEFSPDGSLVALATGDDLILLGRTEVSQWQEKGRQHFDGLVKDFGFSPCGRSIRIDFTKEESVVVTLWQIVPQE